jgi:hypothetical protein
MRTQQGFVRTKLEPKRIQPPGERSKKKRDPEVDSTLNSPRFRRIADHNGIHIKKN